MNLGDLVGALMQGGMSQSGGSRVSHALGQQGLGGSGGLLDQLLGGAGGAPRASGGSGFPAGQGMSASGGGGALGGLMDMAKKVMGDAGRGDPLAAGGLGALAGALFGGGKGAVGGGALALLGSLAMGALKGKNSSGALDQPPSPSQLPVGVRPPANRQEEQELESKAELVLKAMINAAKADGQIDQDELRRIVGRLQQGGVDPEAEQFVQSELRKPLDLEGLVRSVPNRQVAAEVYAASLFAIQVDTAAERDYLQRLAHGLGLDAGVVQRIHSALGVA